MRRLVTLLPGLPAMRSVGVVPLAVLVLATVASPAPAGPTEDVQLHSGILIQENRDGPNNLLVIRTIGGDQTAGDQVGSWFYPFQARASEEPSPNQLTHWVISPQSSNGRGRDLLHWIRKALRQHGVARPHGVFKPGGNDVGNAATFRFRRYGKPVPANYPG